MNEIWLRILAVVIAYLIGNISPSILLAKAKGIDIRKEGLLILDKLKIIKNS